MEEKELKHIYLDNKFSLPETPEQQTVYDEIIKSNIFLNGKKACPNCNAEMHRTPINQPFVNTPGGKILVNINSDSGKMMLSKVETAWNWNCTGCVLGISNYK